MPTLEDMQKLRSAYAPHSPVAEEEILKEIGNPTRQEIVAGALEGLNSEDRNLRVLMLRVLKGQYGEQAMQGILTGLRDKKRRVREVAIKSCQPYLHYPQIIERLEEMVTDEGETKRIRGAALHMLTGYGVGPPLRALPKVAAETLETLSKNEQYREKILFNLLMLDLSEHVESLLKEFVKSGTRKEAVMATKALCGYRVVNIGSFDDEAVVKEITQTCERAGGEVFFWVKQADLRRYRMQYE